MGLTCYRTDLTFFNYSSGVKEVLGIQANEIAKSGDRFYIRNLTKVLEVDFIETPSKTLITASYCVANVMELASTLYEGVAIQNMLGSVYISLFPASNMGYQIKVPELDKYKVLEAKFQGGVLMVVGEYGGKYDRLVFRFKEGYATYDLRVVEDIPLTGLNFVTLANGICVSLTEEEKLEAFSAKSGSTTLRVIEDASLGNDMKLLVANGRAAFERGGKIHNISLK